VIQTVVILICVAAFVTEFFSVLWGWLLLALPSIFLLISLFGVKRKKWRHIPELSEAANRMFQKFGHYYTMPFAGRDFGRSAAILMCAGIPIAIIGAFKGFWWGIGIAVANWYGMYLVSKAFCPIYSLDDPHEQMAHDEVVSYVTDRLRFGKMPESNQGNNRTVTGKSADDGIAGLYEVYAGMSERYRDMGYSYEEAFWIQFTEISFSRVWDENASSEIMLSDILRMYSAFYCRDVRAGVPIQDEPHFLAMLRERFGKADRIVHHHRLDLDQKTLSLGRLVLPENRDVARQIEAGIILMKLADATSRAKIPFRLVKDV